MPIKVGLIGASGYWGCKILDALNGISGIELLACSGKSDQLKLANVVSSHLTKKKRPMETLYYKNITAMSSLDAILISTPAEFHYEITRAALMAGKHVFIEKPMCLDKKEAHALVDLAIAKKRTLFVDHTYLYSNCLRFIKKVIDRGDIGNKLLYMHSNRTQMGKYWPYGVLWDLGPHDLSIFKFLFPNEEIDHVHAFGSSSFNPNANDIFNYNLQCKSGFHVSAFISCCCPVKRRDIIIAGDKGMIMFENNNKVSVYAHNLSKKHIGSGNEHITLLEEYSLTEDPLKEALMVFFSYLSEDVSILPYYAMPNFGADVVGIISSINSHADNIGNNENR